jgi:hypothetical protein
MRFTPVVLISLALRFCPLPAAAQPSQAVFTYFYINGINTPETNNDSRGSCQSERDTVAQNLIDAPISNRNIPRPSGALASIKAGDEIDRMYG